MTTKKATVVEKVLPTKTKKEAYILIDGYMNSHSEFEIAEDTYIETSKIVILNSIEEAHKEVENRVKNDGWNEETGNYLICKIVAYTTKNVVTLNYV